LKHLYQKFLDNQCTPEEVDELVRHVTTHGTSDDLPQVEAVLAKLQRYESLTDDEANRVFHNVVQSKKTVKVKRLALASLAAACISLIALAGVFVLDGNEENIIERTAFGEQRTITLPDQSKVVLHGNSVITYKPSWSSTEPRVVYVEGEAFFEVQHTQNHQPFLVKSNDVFEVKVLGTKFNYFNRKGRREVVLKEGSVQVSVLKDNDVTQIMMRPGEAVVFENKTAALVHTPPKEEVVEALSPTQLLVDDTSLADVIARIEETYGLKMQVADSSLLALKLWGTLPADNLDNLLEGLRLTFDLQIEQSGSTWIVGKPNRIQNQSKQEN